MTPLCTCAVERRVLRLARTGNGIVCDTCGAWYIPRCPMCQDRGSSMTDPRPDVFLDAPVAVFHAIVSGFGGGGIRGCADPDAWIEAVRNNNRPGEGP